MIKEKEITIKVTNQDYEYYFLKGYDIPRVVNKRKKLVVPRGTTILVKIEDVLHGSHESVTILCDLCNSIIRTTSYYNYIDSNHKDKKHICKDCKDKLNEENRLEKEIIKQKKKKEFIQKEFKICCKCKKELPATKEYFYKNKSNIDGLTYDCKECINIPKVIVYNHDDIGKEIDYTDDFKHGIYKILNIINNKIYIGSAVNLYKRMHNHIYQLNNQKHHNKHLQRSWNKYGEENFKFYVVEYIEEINKLIEKEQYWLDFYNSTNINNGYNICSKAGSNLGNKLTEENKINISKAITGRKLSEETKIKIGESNKGKEGVGKKKVVQIDIDGNLIKIWDCISYVKQDGYNPSSVSQCCLNNIVLSGGYFWSYYEDYIKEDFSLPKLKISPNKKVLQFDLNGIFLKEWDSIRLVSKELNINRGSLRTNITNNKPYKGYIWELKEVI